MHIILNGQDYTGLGGIANRVIDDKDKLLLSFGSEDAAAVYGAVQVGTIHSGQARCQHRPKSCGGQEHGGFKDRMKHMFLTGAVAINETSHNFFLAR